MSSGTKYYETRKMKKYRVKQFRENFGVSDTMPWHTSSPSNRAFQFSLRKRLVYTPTLPKSYNSNSKRKPAIVNVDLIPESSDSLEGSVLGKGLIQNVKDVDLGHAVKVDFMHFGRHFDPQFRERMQTLELLVSSPKLEVGPTDP